MEIIKIRYYSQKKQDILFSLLFPGMNRVFVDVGARDGIYISNTYLLEKNHGWNGVCIEPHPVLFKMLKKNRMVSCFNIAVADVDEKGETLEFVMFKNGPVGHSGLLGVTYKNLNEIKGYESEVINVECFPLKKILSDNKIKRVDVLDIDVEGAEFSTIKSIDFEECHFNLISIEAATTEIEEILFEKGFHFLCNLGPDCIYRNAKQIPP